MFEIKIGNRKIGQNQPVYIIAEIGLNHQGDVKLAKQLIDCALKAKADCVKFQKRSLKNVYASHVLEDVGKEEHGTNYSLYHIKKVEFTNDQMRELYLYALSKNIDFLCTPWDEESLNFLNNLGLPAFKIASADMFNLKLLGKVAALKKPMLISTGMSFISEIEQLVDFLKKMNAEYVLLHCNSTYPAPYHDVNLNFIKVLQDRFSPIVGYSGHELGISVSLAAVTMGARVIERHLTLDRAMTGPDHKASLHPEEFEELVKQIRILELALGDGIRFPSRGEYLNRETLAKSIVAARPLKKGTIITHADLDVKSPGKGTNPLKLDIFVGKKLVTRNVKKDDYLLESDINLRPRELYKPVKTKHRWGVVARMSDINTLIKCRSDFIEIHLTDSDVINDYKYNTRYDIDLVVHGPEYNVDLLLDLSSADPSVRKRSVEFFNRALDHARKLKRLFRNHHQAVKFVVHPGGMDLEHPLLDRIEEHNTNFLKSLKALNFDGFEPLLENMPGCAWYFGGQQYQSNFMAAEEIVTFANKYNYGITFDTSHAALYCNYYGRDLNEFTRTILPVTKYIHISDAAKYNGEGLQIGDGTIDFKSTLRQLFDANLWFLPEIWQGHKFGGEGFLKAIKRLKDINPEF
ncbi:MAG: N-acetylneuraminate synthase family protein [Candidatus Yanofskybacteria bacterium]|nr:N-acetylneuraminate synthase family protein [Candidatus Yanofskybacteria bacterium]